MSLFGIDNSIGKPAVQEAVSKLEPLFREVEMRAAGILDTLVSRIGKAKVTITIEIPKAGDDWEKGGDLDAKKS
jgi:hypothetical protein